jgi:S1-C subfamily serine protease
MKTAVEIFNWIIVVIVGFTVSTSFGQSEKDLLKLAGFNYLTNTTTLCGFGTAFAISSDGYLITAQHVIDDSDEVRIVFKDGESVSAKIIHEEENLDVAVLKVNTRMRNYLGLSPSTLSLGEDVFTIGYPAPIKLGLNQKFNDGSISSLTGLDDDVFNYQISVPIQPGNSGGPLVSYKTGCVDGIIISTLNYKAVDFLPQSVNYALKSGFIRPIIDALGINSKSSASSLSRGEIRANVANSSFLVVTSKTDSGESTFQPRPMKEQNPVERTQIGSSLDKLFSGDLYDSNERRVSKSSLRGKIIGVLFSAHWCPPCREFVPKLVDFKRRNSQHFEVVFVSSDKDENSQFRYMREYSMDWFTTIYGSYESKDLKERFNIKGIPSLVILSPEGEVITLNGRGDVAKSPNDAMRLWKRYL